MADPELEIVADTDDWRAQFYRVRFPGTTPDDEVRKYLNEMQNAIKRYPVNQGPQGFQGANGPQGPQGFRGPQGNLGASGSNGPQGPPGNQGANGADGDDGPQGYQGNPCCDVSMYIGTNPYNYGWVEYPDPAEAFVILHPQATCGEYDMELVLNPRSGPQGVQGPPSAIQGPQGIAPSGPQGFGGVQGPQGPDGNQGPDGDPTKMAIIRARDAYVAMFCVESPDVRFLDVVTARRGETELDPTYLLACEPGSIKAVGYTADIPTSAAIRVLGDTLFIESEVDCNFTVKLSGIRRGRSGVRFTRKTEMERARNNRFWARANQG